MARFPRITSSRRRRLRPASEARASFQALRKHSVRPVACSVMVPRRKLVRTPEQVLSPSQEKWKSRTSAMSTHPVFFPSASSRVRLQSFQYRTRIRRPEVDVSVSVEFHPF